MTSLPNGIAFGLVGTVTAEIFTGASGGMGYNLALATHNVNSDLLYSVVLLLAAVGVVLVLGAAWLKRKLLPWWETNVGV